MSNIYIGYHFTIEPKELGSEILIAELGEKAFSGNGNKIQNKDYEIEKLKKEIEELKKDNEILKKFHAFLARKK